MLCVRLLGHSAERYKTAEEIKLNILILLEQNIKAAVATMMNQFQEGFLSNGTGYAGL